MLERRSSLRESGFLSQLPARFSCFAQLALGNVLVRRYAQFLMQGALVLAESLADPVLLLSFLFGRHALLTNTVKSLTERGGSSKREKTLNIIILSIIRVNLFLPSFPFRVSRPLVFPVLRCSIEFAV